MGIALDIGVATKISIEKKSGFKMYSKDEILEKLKDCLNLELYNIDEDEESVLLEIKEDIFLKNIYNLLLTETLSSKWKNEDKENFDKLLLSIKKAKSINEVEEIVKDKGSYYMFFCEGCPWEDISYISDEDLNIIPKMLVFENSYKVIFETYYSIFRYLRAKIQQAIDNPLKDDVFLMLATG